MEAAPVFTGGGYVLAVHDLAASARFYIETLGFADLGFDAPGWRFLMRDGVRIDIGECRDAIAPADLGDHSFFARIHVSDIDAYHAEIAGRGARIIAPPTDKPWGLREMAVRTIDGHRILFDQRL